jgi:hypothetical protein
MMLKIIHGTYPTKTILFFSLMPINNTAAIFHTGTIYFWLVLTPPN